MTANREGGVDARAFDGVFGDQFELLRCVPSEEGHLPPYRERPAANEVFEYRENVVLRRTMLAASGRHWRARQVLGDLGFDQLGGYGN